MANIPTPPDAQILSDPYEKSHNSPTPIKLEQLSSVPAISAIGLVAARVLQQHNIVTLMVGASGVIELVPDGELELDRMAEHDALVYLTQIGYTDEQLSSYLQQREVRLTRRNVQNNSL